MLEKDTDVPVDARVVADTRTVFCEAVERGVDMMLRVWSESTCSHDTGARTTEWRLQQFAI